MVDSSFDKLILKMQAPYLKDLLAQAKKLYENKANYQDSEKFFHQIKGSGLTYGVAILSELAKDSEAFCKKAIENPELEKKISLEQVLCLMIHLIETVQEHSSQFSQEKFISEDWKLLKAIIGKA